MIDSRRNLVNYGLAGGLIAWSFLVTVIRSYNDISSWFEGIALLESNFVVAFLDFYVPALVVEGLVRIIPLVIKGLSKWIRFKTLSEVDHYVLRWYFAYRLVTFVFVIFGYVNGPNKF